MTIQKIREDILDLRGKEVLIFGQKQTLRAELDEDTIDILDVLNEIEGNEASLTYEIDSEEAEEGEEEMVFDEIQEMVDHMTEYDLWKELKHDNTYNWGAPLSNNIDFKIFADKLNDKYYVQFNVHRFGDVRANYTEYALLEYDSEDGFIYDLAEVKKRIEVGDYTVEVDIFQDSLDVMDADGDFVKSIHDIDDFRKEVENGQVEGD